MENPSPPQPPLLKPGIHFGVPTEVYRADPGYNQSALKKFGGARTPAHYKEELSGPGAKELQEKDFIRIGSYVDAFLFGGDMEHYVIAPETYPCDPTKRDPRTSKPWSYRADYCTAWKEQQAAKGRVVLTGNELARANGCIKAVMAHEDCWATIKLCEYQVVVIAEHPTLGYRLKGALDLWPKRMMDWVWDFKTSFDGSVPGFTDHAASMGYHIQAKFYLDLLRWCPEELVINNFGFLVVENERPHGVNSFYTTYDSPELKRAGELITQWLPEYHRCMTSDTWHCYPPKWNKLVFKKWALSQAEEVPTLV